MFKRRFKYNLNHRLSLTPRHLSIETIIVRLQVEQGIPEALFKNDRKIPAGSRQTIPYSRLRRYAVFFHCSVLDLRDTTALRLRAKIDAKLRVRRFTAGRWDGR